MYPKIIDAEEQICGGITPMSFQNELLDALLGICPDRRFRRYYHQMANCLSARTATKPEPGVEFSCDDEFAGFYEIEYGNTPFIAAPHNEGCLAWRPKGGDMAGLNHCLKLAYSLHSLGKPTACLYARAGQPPEYLYNGLSDCGCSRLHENIIAMIENTSLDWSIDPDAKAWSVNFGHHFVTRRYDDQALYFSSRCVQPEAMPVIGSVVLHYAGMPKMPGYLSEELSERRKTDIVMLCHDYGLPIYFPQFAA